MGVQTVANKDNKLVDKIDNLEGNILKLSETCDKLHKETVQLECEKMVLKHLKERMTEELDIHLFNIDVVRNQHQEIDKVLDERKKVEFTHETTESIVRLGYNVCDAERHSIKKMKIDELLNKRKHLMTLELEYRTLKKEFAHVSRTREDKILDSRRLNAIVKSTLIIILP
jgi:hypothetical protein